MDVIDNKKQSAGKTATVTASTTNLIDRKPIRRKPHPNQRIGHSMFSVVNLHDDNSVFVKVDPKDATTIKSTTTTTTTAQSSSADNSNVIAGGSGSIDPTTSVKKELDSIEMVETSVVPNNTMEIQIKDEPIDEIHTPKIEEQHSLRVRQHIVPVIKTEIGNSVPIVSNAAIHRPITIHQAAHLRQQTHPQTFTTNDQTLILSSRPIRRLTTNGPADGKAGEFQCINKFNEMVFFSSSI